VPWRKYHTIWFVMAFGWVALYVVRMGISPVLGMIMEEFHISYATAGSLFSAIFLSYTLMQVPSGYLGDRFGRRKILIISTVLWFFFSLGTALVQSFAMLVAVRFLTGFAHGAYFGNEKPTIVAFTPVEKMGQGQAVSFMGLAFGFFAFGVWPPYYALLGELAPKGIVGTTFGLANLIGFLSSWVAPFFTGWVKDTTGSFSGGMYVAAFVLAAGIILILAVKTPKAAYP